MTTVEELREAEPGVFTRAAQRWQELAKSMATRVEETGRGLTGLAEWQGKAAETAKQQITDQRNRLDDLVRGLSGIPPVLREAGERLTRLQISLRNELASAHAHHLRVASDGLVVDGAVVVAKPIPQGAPDRATLCADLTASLRGILREAATVDAEAAAALRRITQDATGMAPGGIEVCTPASATIPAAGTSPAEVKRWWDGLSIADRESLLATDGARIGALDGIPAAVRNRANRVVLAGLQAGLLEEKTRLEAKPNRTNDDQQRLVELTGKLKGLDAVAARLQDRTKGEAFLLGVSAEGNGRAIVAMGNPDTARNVATLVPGTGSNLAGTGDYLERADRMVTAAWEAKSVATSVISWVGYDSPQTVVPDAASEKFAQNAREGLARFQEGLRATHEGLPSHNTVVGHSYGSTVIGHAARDLGLKADDLVFLGSPGVGVERADQLNIAPERVHASVAEHDFIKATNVPVGLDRDNLPLDPLGPDPADKRFGGKVFASDPGTSNAGFPSIAAHMEYWEERSKSLQNMGKIIVGKPAN